MSETVILPSILHGLPAMMNPVGNILLIQLGDIGDVVLTTPTVRAIKETYPAARVSILVRSPCGSILAADPNLHEVIETGKPRRGGFHLLKEYLRFAGRLRRARYDLVIDVRTGDRGAILAFLTRAPLRIGRHGSEKPFWHSLLFTQLVRNPPHGRFPVHPGADQSLRIVRAIGIDTKESTPRLYVSEEDRARAVQLLGQFGLGRAERWVTLNPFSRWKYKEWDGSKWSEAIDWIWHAHGLPTVLVGSPDEASGCAAIIAKCRGRTINLAGRTTLGELAAVIEKSTLHLGVDSAAPHISAAVGTPTITIHGPSDWHAWRVVSEMQRVITPALPCVPCNRKGCNDTGRSLCLEQLEPKTVLDTVDTLLHDLAGRSR